MTDTGAGQALTDAEYRQRCDFLIRLALAAYEAGIPASRLEPYLHQVADQLGVRVDVITAPPLVTFIFSAGDDDQQRQVTERMPAVAYDLGKVAGIGDLMDQLGDGELPLDVGERRLVELQGGPPRFGILPMAIGFVLIGFGLAAVLTGSWWSSAVAGLLGLVTFVAYGSLATRQSWQPVSDLVTTFIVSVLAQVAAGLVTDFNPYVVILCAIVVLVPGLDLAIGVVDMASGSTLMGLSRFIRGVFVTLKLFIGTIAGVGLVRLAWPEPQPTIAPGEIPMPLPLIFFLLALGGLVMVFQVAARDQLWVVGLCFVAAMVFALASGLGSWQGTFAASVLVYLTASWYSLRLHRPATILLLPGFLLLVPGIAAYVGLVNLQLSGSQAGAAAAASVAVQMTAILLALVLCATLVPRRPGL